MNPPDATPDKEELSTDKKEEEPLQSSVAAPEKTEAKPTPPLDKKKEDKQAAPEKTEAKPTTPLDQNEEDKEAKPTPPLDKNEEDKEKVHQTIPSKEKIDEVKPLSTDQKEESKTTPPSTDMETVKKVEDSKQDQKEKALPKPSDFFDVKKKSTYPTIVSNPPAWEISYQVAEETSKFLHMPPLPVEAADSVRSLKKHGYFQGETTYITHGTYCVGGHSLASLLPGQWLSYQKDKGPNVSIVFSNSLHATWPFNERRYF